MSNTPPRSFLFSLLDVIAGFVDGISQTWQRFWRWFADGILQHIVFYLLLLISGLIVIITAVCEELDRYLARLEKGLISLFMLVMVGLSFLDYMKNSFFGPNRRGPNMAVVLLDLGGDFGASLAVRQKKHLDRRHRSDPVTRSHGWQLLPDGCTILLEFGGYAVDLIRTLFERVLDKMRSHCGTV